MQILIILAIIFFIIIWASIKYSSQTKAIQKARKSGRKQLVEVRNATSVQNDNPDTGSVTPSQDEGWILNPKSTFTLTVYGIDREKALKLKSILEEGYYLNYKTISQKILSIILSPSFSCKEIDDYINEYKPKLLKEIEKIKNSSDEWQLASDEEREDLLEEIRDEALDIVDKQPYCDFLTLFEFERKDIIPVLKFIFKYGYKNIKNYFRFSKNIEKIYVLDSNHKDIDIFNELVKCDLAINEKNILVLDILTNLKLKQLNEIINESMRKGFTRKDKAIEFLIEFPNVREQVNNLLPSIHFYKLKELPTDFNLIDSSKINETLEYFSEIAELMLHTYIMGGFAVSHYANNRGMKSSNFIGWEISPVNDGCTCSFCERASKKKYPKNKYPKVPLHIGCRCSVLAKFK